jgi:hypothetical protein
MYKDRYVDPGAGRLPMSKNFTVSDYAKIPGLKGTNMFTTTVTSNQLLLTRNLTSPTAPRTPLDFALVNSRYWRGSLKVLLQFFASSFTSARFVVQYRNQYDGSFDTDYDNGISRVIDVKGDTQELITLPWLSSSWWTNVDPPEIKVSLISTIATTDPAADAVIYMNTWVAGGDDIQFAWPRVPLIGDWPYRTPSTSSIFRGRQQRHADAEKIQAQSAIGRIFEKSFPPIAEDCFAEVDRGLCTNETLGSIADICKRYSRMLTNYSFDETFFLGATLDNYFSAPASGLDYGAWQAFRQTYFGLWRSAFLCRSGGYRLRVFPNNAYLWSVADHSGNPYCPGTDYCPPYDQTARLTVPQLIPQAFGFMGAQNFQLDTYQQSESEGDTPFYIAARDDIQLGYPILPSGIPINYSPPSEVKGSDKGELSSSRKLRTVRQL